MKEILISDKRILYIDNDMCLSYKKGWLYYNEKNANEQKCFIGSNLNRFSLVERVMRLEPRCAAKIDSNHYIVSFNGIIINYCSSDNTTKIEHRFEKGMHNPLTFLTIHESSKDENDVYYGEYIWNENKGPVDIYKRCQGRWTKVYSFPNNTILHIHNLIHDPYRKGIIILTGDNDSESGIWFADYDFNHVVPILIGKQQYRACIAFPYKDGILFATDTPLEENYIYRVDLKTDKPILIKEYEIPGPCIYGIRINNELFFSTSVEPDSTLKPWHYRITYRLGKGVKDRYTYIIKRDKEGHYETVFKEKKDIFPIWMFQFGNVLFPMNRTNMVIGVFQSLINGHGKSFRLE